MTRCYAPLTKKINIMKKDLKVLICNNCKDIWIAPKDRCKCGCTTLTETHKSNYKYAQNYNGA